MEQLREANATRTHELVAAISTFGHAFTPLGILTPPQLAQHLARELQVDVTRRVPHLHTGRHEALGRHLRVNRSAVLVEDGEKSFCSSGKPAR
jgi:hypothetical protein